MEPNEYGAESVFNPILEDRCFRGHGFARPKPHLNAIYKKAGENGIILASRPQDQLLSLDRTLRNGMGTRGA
jgi:hypothetical protein